MDFKSIVVESLFNSASTIHIMNGVRLILLLAMLNPFGLHAEEQPDATKEGFGEWLWDYLTVGASITAGIGGRSVAIDVTRQGTDDHGKIVKNNEEAYFLFYSTKAGYFGRSNAGYAWLLNLSSIHLRQQELADGETMEFGTQVNGYFASTVPTVFYNIGDRHRGHYLRAGIGIGLGLAKFSGDIMLTEPSQSREWVSISNGASNVFLAYGVFIHYQLGNFTIRLSTAGPNLEYNNYDIAVTGTSLVLGYTFYL